MVGGGCALAAVTGDVGVLRRQVSEGVVRAGDSAAEDVEDSRLQGRQTSLYEQNLQAKHTQSKQSCIHIETQPI